MTAPLEGVTSPPPKGRLVKVALALSLMLNVCFVGGLVYSKFVRPTPPLIALGHELNLEPEQRKAFQTLVQAVRSKGAVLREANLALGRKVWDELSQPKPDEQKLSALLAEIANNRRDYQAAVGAVMLPFLETLNVEQRERFIEIGKRRQDGMANRMRQLLGP